MTAVSSTPSTSVPPHRWLALATALAVVVSGLAVAAAPRAQAAEHAITEGTVTWGFKESWRSYIGAGGTTLSEGVVRNAAGTFEWPVESGTFDDATKTLHLDLAGAAHFQSYPNPDGSFVLDSKFENLRLVISPTEQTIRGDYLGNPRDGGEQVIVRDGILATIDTASAAVTSADGTTTWTDATTLGGPQNGLYAEGTPFDPVSISYAGPGGVPDTGEVFATQGAPRLTPGDTWVDETGVDDGRIVFASQEHDVIHVVQRRDFGIGSATAAYVLRAIDASTMTQLGSTTIDATDERQWFKATFDPATDAIFLADGDPDSAGGRIHRAVYDPVAHTYGDEVIATIAPIDSSPSNHITSLAWDPTRDEVVVQMSRVLAADRRFQGRLSFLSASAAGEPWTAETHEVRLPDAEEVTGTLSSASPVGTSRTLAAGQFVTVLRDGSYVLLHGGTFRRAGDPQTRNVPAMHLTRDDEGIQLSYIAGTAPAPLSQNVAINYVGVTTAADGSAMLFGNQHQYVDVVDGAVVADPATPVHPGVEAYSWTASDPAHGIDYSMAGYITTLFARVARQSVASYVLDDVSRGGTGTFYPLAVLPDGDVLLLVKDPETGSTGLRRFEFGGVAATVTGQPTSQTVSLPAGVASQDVSFSSTSSGGTGEVERQWQVKAPAASSFSDIEGESSETLTVAAAPGMAGTQYRALYTNEAGTVASEPATLSVDFAPVVVADARDQTATEGQSASFVTSFDAQPEPTYTWQVQVGGFWTDVVSDDNFAVNGAALTVTSTNPAQSGSLFRVKASNSAGTTVSRAARLTVNPATEIPDEGLELTGVELEWSGSSELQKSPPFGVSNFLSAGASDGSESTYAAIDRDVSVVHRAADGSEVAATWASRHAPTEGALTQLVRLGGGDARLEADGTATVTWDGSWSVNFYGGLVPFTLTDPELAVDAGGVGTLTADLSGYASSMENPNERSPLEPVADVTVATFRDVEIDPTGVVSIAPDYAGVEVTVPPEHTAQNRTNAGWGSWPQEFVDFHVVSGLSSYWYSSGGAADPFKAPAPFEVDFTGAEPAESEPVTAPVITTQPASVRVAKGGPMSLTVSAQGQELSYAWQRKLGSFWFPLSGGGSPTLDVQSVSSDDAGSYRVVISNEAGAVASSTVVVTVVDGFTDVPGSHTFADEITWLAVRNITTGYADGTFRGSAPVLREQIAAFLYRYAGSPEVDVPAVSPFSDVPVTHTFYREIVWLSQVGITTGYADGTFRGSAPVLREQIAAFLYRFAESSAGDPATSRFTDVPRSHAFFTEVEWLAATAITTGYEDGTFRGSAPVLREQIAAFLYRYDRTVE